jgi:thioesterase domain-containing protein
LKAAAAAELQRRIHQAIPLSRTLGYQITTLSLTQMVVKAPLGPNINIHGTGFAGSLYALGILTAWGLCDHILAQAAAAADLVVAQAEIEYHAPVCGDIVCECCIDEQASQEFVAALAAHGRARLSTEVRIGEKPDVVIRALMVARRR